MTVTSGQPASAAPFVPPGADLQELRRASRRCRGCPLYKQATQTVFGEGSPKARIVLLGEAPGNREDIEGRPFVGPAGRFLDKALAEIDVARRDVYISNVVKHFKFTKKGKIRFHQKPSGGEIRACKPWLEAELGQIKPRVTVCLGASAAQSLLQRHVTLKDERGVLTSSPLSGQLLITVHPSSILRIPDEASRHAEYARFVADLKLLRRL